MNEMQFNALYERYKKGEISLYKLPASVIEEIQKILEREKNNESTTSGNSN